MTLPSHIVVGLIIGKLTDNYPLAIASSVLIDVDHLQSYVKSGVLFKPKLFWKTITDKADPYGDQRGYLHNAVVFIVGSILLALILGYTTTPLILGWLGHLALDAFDNSDYWPLYPYKGLNLRGPIVYASHQEAVFSFLLLSIYFFI
jgi:membrane-bound metal-dependent hydrolase YbcI (DUF457 family)